MHNVGQWQRWFSLLMKRTPVVLYGGNSVTVLTVAALIDLQQCFDIYLTAGALSMFSAFI